MKKKLLVLLTLFAFMPFVNAEEYLTVDRDTQSNGVETVPAGEEGSFELFYDAETKKFQVIYNITTEAPDEITLDLSKAIELVEEYGRLAIEGNPAIQDYIDAGYEKLSFKYKGTSYTLDLKSMKTTIGVSPGSTIRFVVTIKNSSGKAYVYKEDSLTISTPKQPETESNIVGFDGQKLDKDLTNSTLVIGFNGNLSDKNIINNFADKALDTYKPLIRSYYVNANGELVKEKVTFDIKKDEPIVKIGRYYYYQVHDYYIRVTSNLDKINLVVKKDTKNVSGIAYDSNGITFKYEDGLSEEKYEGRQYVSQPDATEAITKYLKNNYNGDIVLALIAEFNEKYNTTYNSLEEFSKEDYTSFIREISQTYTREVGTLEFNDSGKYDVLYTNNLSAVITTEEEFDSIYNANPEWATKTEGALTVGKYMDEKVNGDTTGKYKETDTFLNETVGELKNEENTSFMYAINIDGQTNNNYQNYRFGIYTSIKMVAKKGVVIINYVDEDGKPLQESETVEYYYYEDYETKAASFEDYELIEVEGLEKGTIEQDETVVTYIYQFTGGQGGEEQEEEKEVVQTGSEIDYSIMTSAFITISLIGLAIYSNRKEK